MSKLQKVTNAWRLINIFWWHWNMNSGPQLIDAVPLEAHSQPFFVLVSVGVGIHNFAPWFSYLCHPELGNSHVPPCPHNWLRWTLTNILARLASNCYPANLCFFSSWNYKCETLHLNSDTFLNHKWAVENISGQIKNS
jgi:hypothetical protein